jgi:uncharacterized protein (DUF58 family)
MAFIHPEKISLLSSFEIRVKAIVEGILNGLHKSPYHGFSVEFLEYRNYYKGDNPKYVDWKVFGKTDKLLLKKYEAETNLSAIAMIDMSKSMDYSGKLLYSKFEYVKNFVAALFFVLQKQNDSISLSVFDENINEAKSSKFHFNRILSFLENLKTKENFSSEKYLKNIEKNFQKKGLVFIFSDFLEDFNKIKKNILLLKNKGNHLFLFKISTEEEENFPFDDETVFYELESEKNITLEPKKVREIYLKNRKKHFSKIAEFTRKHAIDFFEISANGFYEEQLLRFFQDCKK